VRLYTSLLPRLTTPSAAFTNLFQTFEVIRRVVPPLLASIPVTLTSPQLSERTLDDAASFDDGDAFQIQIWDGRGANESCCTSPTRVIVV
jgi:hypothetical protein